MAKSIAFEDFESLQERKKMISNNITRVKPKLSLDFNCFSSPAVNSLKEEFIIDLLYGKDGIHFERIYI